jgi:PPM family protein phosphatase
VRHERQKYSATRGPGALKHALHTGYGFISISGVSQTLQDSGKTVERRREETRTSAWNGARRRELASRELQKVHPLTDQCTTTIGEMFPRPRWGRYRAAFEGAPQNPAYIIEWLMFECFGLTDRGCVRGNNEDSFLTEEQLGLYIVADGMGGAQAGEHASRIAVQAVRDYVARNGSRDAQGLVHAFEEANRKVMEASSSDASLEGMGTTLVAALDSGTEVLFASVGDSRAYVFENGSLIPITEDQTWVNEVGRRLGMDDAALRSHPMRHVLTMAVGVSHALRVLSYARRPAPGTQFLLCSDGLHGVVEPAVLEGVLRSDATLQEKCRALIEAARQAGGPDNITAVLLRAR